MSVIIPTHNRADFLLKSINSVLRQTYRDIELIVVDDGSTDETLQVVSGLADRRVRLVRHEYKRGPSAARNSGLRNANGQYVAFLDSDDEWLPEKLQKQIDAFHQMPEDVGMIRAMGWYFDEHTCWLGDNNNVSLDDQASEKRGIDPRSWGARLSSWLLHADVVDEVGEFDEDLPMSLYEDADYLIRVSSRYRIFDMEEPLYFYRHVGEDAVSSSSELAKINARLYLLRKHIDRFLTDPTVLRQFSQQQVEIAYRETHSIAESIRVLRKIIGILGLNREGWAIMVGSAFMLISKASREAFAPLLPEALKSRLRSATWTRR